MKIRKMKRVFCFFILIIIGILITFFYNNIQKRLGQTQEDPTDNVNVVQSNIVVNGQKISDLKQNITIEPHVDENTGVKYVTYEDFGAKAQEGYDDYNVIKATHEFANENQYEVRAEKGKTYHIYRLEETEPIIIQTNTNWNNANIVIHDENINDKDTRNYAIFQIMPNTEDIVISDTSKLENIKLNKKTTKIEELAGYGQCLCIVYNEDKKHFIRSGENQNSGASQEDLFKIDNEGNILNEVQWDFEKITSIRLKKIPEETITIENANFTTILPENDYEQESGYFNRNIDCKRSNTVIKNIKHNVNDISRVAGPYFGFLRISYVADVTLKDSSLYSHKYSVKSNYDLILEHSINVTIDNVTSNDIEDTQRWGITGTNYTKDVIYRNCTLNRIDAHCGVHNLTVENSTIGVKGFTLIGSGELNLKNVIRVGSSSFIELRADYGSTWNGNINIEDCTYIPTNSKQIISFTTTYDSNGSPHDYGYDLYLPNVNINNLKIEDENNSNSSNEYYIFYNDVDNVETPNGDMTNAYNLPENVILNSYETTSGKKIKLFYNKFYNSLDDLGINLSIPLSDKEDVEITNESGNDIKDQDITNQNIKIKIPKVEGIETTVLVNDKKVEEAETQLNEDDNYKIDITYKNSNGELESNLKNIVIDKTLPQISGVENGTTYSESVTPEITDEHLKEVQLKLNGQVVEGYVSGNEIKEEGKYELTAKDEAENETKVEFEIQYKLEPESEEYTLEDNYIIGIKQNTKLEDFIKTFNANEDYKIYREEELLKYGEIVATGDKLVTEKEETFYIIVKGDITKDGTTTVKDLVKMRRNILGIEEFDECQEKAADLAKDNEITVKDLVRIRKIILGQEI